MKSSAGHKPDPESLKPIIADKINLRDGITDKMVQVQLARKLQVTISFGASAAQLFLP